jgi:hypothetical protein
LDKSGADGFRDEVLLMREVLEDWCALRGVRLDSSAAVKAASILLGLGRGRDLRRQQLRRPFFRWPQTAGVKVFASRQSIMPIGKPPLR